MLKLLLVVLTVGCVRSCYWNSPCLYQLYGSKTPYDTVRGDIRDYPKPENCEAVSIWTLNRHGNRNPGTSVTTGMRDISLLKDQIIASFEAGNSELCAQDIADFKNWKWNVTLEGSQSYLTGIGYEELYNLGARIREKYHDLLRGPPTRFYFRPTNEQRTITSCTAFVHGLTDGMNLNVTMEEAWQRDDVVRPYENCDRYQQDVKIGQNLADQLDQYFIAPEYIAIQSDVQKRLGIPLQLNAANVFSLYEMCRFHRSWSPVLKSPWCSVFTEHELVVLEFYDDLRHYYRNGYGSWVNEKLGRMPIKDMYDNFMAFVQNGGRKFVSYFTHDTMMEMVFCALGLYKEDSPLQALAMDPDRTWRTSYIGAFATNLIAVLNSCGDSGSQSYRVQIFINEKLTPICPVNGCSLLEFQTKFQSFANANLDFCSMNYVYENDVSVNKASTTKGFWNW